MRRSIVPFAALVVAACTMAAPATTTSTTTASPVARATTLGPAEREVLAVVERLFDGMRARDTAAMRALFEPGARLQSVATRQGTLAISEDSLGAFLRAIGTPHPQMFDERIANERVLIDGPYAVAWVDYTFYLGTQKSHCGVDALQMVRRPAGWRILGVTDTRRRENCPDLPRR